MQLVATRIVAVLSSQEKNITTNMLQ